MLNHKTMKLIYLYSLVVLFLSFCTNNNNSNSVSTNINSKDSTEIKPSATNQDTLDFESVGAINKFFDFKMDSIGKLLKESRIKKDKKFSNKIDMLDSIFLIVNLEKKKSIWKLLKNQHETTEDMRGMFYIVRDFNFQTGDIAELYELFPKKEKESPMGQFVSQQLEERKKREINMAIPKELMSYNFSNSEGGMVSFKSLGKKYTFIEFWSSWCLPCRQENKDLVKISEKIRNEDFVIVTFSLDVNKEKWIRALATDKIPFVNISDLKGWDSPIAKKLLVNAIPYSILINQEGKILAYNLKKEKLIEFLNSLP